MFLPDRLSLFLPNRLSKPRPFAIYARVQAVLLCGSDSRELRVHYYRIMLTICTLRRPKYASLRSCMNFEERLTCVFVNLAAKVCPFQFSIFKNLNEVSRLEASSYLSGPAVLLSLLFSDSLGNRAQTFSF